MQRVVDDRLLQEVVRRTLTVTQPERIVLFGSAASGRLSEESDLDTLVLKAKTGNTRQERVQIGEALGGIGCFCDVFVMRAETFEESKAVIGGLAYPANTYGRVIYEAA